MDTLLKNTDSLRVAEVVKGRHGGLGTFHSSVRQLAQACAATLVLLDRAELKECGHKFLSSG